MHKSVDYGDILKRAKLLTLKNKWLWVYGLVIAVFGGGGSLGSQFNFPGGGSSSPTKLKLPEKLPENLPENTKQVLGSATSALKDWLVSVPLTTWLLLILIIFVSITVSAIIGIVVRNWAKAALISGTIKAMASDTPVTLTQTAPAGRKYMKNLFLFSLIHGVMSLIIMGILATPILIVTLVIQNIFLTVIVGIIAGLGLLIASLLLNFLSFYAERLVILHDFEPFAAWKRGFKLAKTNFLPTFITSLLSNAVGCGVGCLAALAITLVAGVLAVIIFVPTLVSLNKIYPIQVVIGIILLILVSNAGLVVSAGLTVFNYSVWTIFVNDMLKDEKDL